MKRVVLLALALVMLVGIVAGATVYAQTVHQATKGAKLIGVAHCGKNPMTGLTEDIVSVRYLDTGINITNPNCSKAVMLTYLAILREDGTVVHEGTPKQWNDNGWVGTNTPVPEQLGPHEIWQCAIVYLIGGAPVVPGDTYPLYTVEVSWSGAVDRPLVGSLLSHAMAVYFIGFDPQIPWQEQAESILEEAWESQMTNFPR